MPIQTVVSVESLKMRLNMTLYDYSISKVVLPFVELDTLISLKSSVAMPTKY